MSLFIDSMALHRTALVLVVVCTVWQCAMAGIGNGLIEDGDLPVARPADWDYRSMWGASWTIKTDPVTRSTKSYVKHMPLKGVTSAMVNWWLRKVNGTVVDFRDGKAYNAYHLWHPRCERNYCLDCTVPPSRHGAIRLTWHECTGAPQAQMAIAWADMRADICLAT